MRPSLLTFVLLGIAATYAAEAPKTLRPWDKDEARVRLPDGTLKQLYIDTKGFGAAVVSTDDGKTWSQPETPVKRWASKAFLDRDGQLHGFAILLRQEQQGKRIAVDRFIDVWHFQTAGPEKTWQLAATIQTGWNGSIVSGPVQLPSGRIVLPSQDWTPHSKPVPPTGNGYVVMLYSDDGGKSWTRSNPITAPVFEGYNGANVGACEATIILREDGTLWALMRTQTGFLYESTSPDGAVWSEGKPSPFHSSTGPASLLRLPDKRLLLVWNNCEMPPRVNGAGVYAGRDALHAAISDDDGKAWKGFREMALDPRRHESPPKKGDRGVAYPYAVLSVDGKSAEVTAGHGAGRAVFRLDPNWLLEKEHGDDFSNGLEKWSTFKPFGPTERWWRDRAPGAELTNDPDKPGTKVLHLRKPDEKDADGAVWNFPAGYAGSLKLRLRLREGQQGARIQLADRFFEPTDENVNAKAVYGLAISADGTLEGSNYRFPFEQWVDVELKWDDRKQTCEILAAGKSVVSIAQRNPSAHGVSYLHLRSTARERDPAGFLIGGVHAVVE